MSQIPKAAIYTKKGDSGTTSLVDGTHVPKHHPRVSAYGDVDELNSVMGLLTLSLKKNLPTEAWHAAESEPQVSLEVCLFKIQNHLFNIGSLLACENTLLLKQLPRLTQDHVTWLEGQIDYYNFQLPPLQEFILPGGHEAAAWAHMARTVCRRAERHVSQLGLPIDDYGPCLIYLNRLSDFFFTLSRFVHLKTKTPEVKWNSKI